ncbi:Uncharacterised protein [uncultured archaeon]|nr:Uncharacterised protein [uncultured archaeon]
MNAAYKYLAIILLLLINVRIINAEPVQIDLNDSQGGIDYNIFNMSIPQQMTIGESHTLKVFLRNNGDIKNKFRVLIRTTESSMPASPDDLRYKEYIYPRYASKLSVLDTGETRRLDFNIVAVKPYLGNLEISADLYVLRSSDNQLKSDFVLVDHVSKEVRVIKPAFDGYELALYFIILLIVIIISVKLIKNRKVHAARKSPGNLNL